MGASSSRKGIERRSRFSGSRNRNVSASNCAQSEPNALSVPQQAREDGLRRLSLYSRALSWRPIILVPFQLPQLLEAYPRDMPVVEGDVDRAGERILRALVPGDPTWLGAMAGNGQHIHPRNGRPRDEPRLQVCGREVSLLRPYVPVGNPVGEDRRL